MFWMSACLLNLCLFQNHPTIAYKCIMERVICQHYSNIQDLLQKQFLRFWYNTITKISWHKVDMHTLCILSLIWNVQLLFGSGQSFRHGAYIENLGSCRVNSKTWNCMLGKSIWTSMTFILSNNLTLYLQLKWPCLTLTCIQWKLWCVDLQGRPWVGWLARGHS